MPRPRWSWVLCLVAATADESRLQLLTNNFKAIATDDPVTVDVDDPAMVPDTLYVVDGHTLARIPKNKRPGQFPQYLVDDLISLGLMDVKFYFRLGDSTDRVDNVTVLVKSRRIGDQNAVLYPINRDRHYPSRVFDYMVLHDMPFRQKLPIAMWRGSTTGRKANNPRVSLVEQYWNAQPRIDVGFSAILPGFDSVADKVRGKMEWTEMLRYKYIIAVEGNDVATGLKWQMFSNSLVVMAPPTKESWFLESRLVPFVHYLPIWPNMSNLPQMLDWADAHPDACEAIAANATKYAADVYYHRVKSPVERERVLEIILAGKYVFPVERAVPPSRPRFPSPNTS